MEKAVQVVCKGEEVNMSQKNPKYVFYTLYKLDLAT